MNKYDVTITRTGGIVIEANNKEEAINKVMDMSVSEIDLKGNLTGWEPSDASEITDLQNKNESEERVNE